MTDPFVIANDGEEDLYIDPSVWVKSSKRKKFSAKTDKKFRLIPNKNMRDVLYIYGPSNSGKTTFARNYMKDYIKMYPNNKVYLFSEVVDPSDYEGIPKKLSVEDAKDYDDDFFKNSLVIFDDVDNVKDKQVLKDLQNLKNRLLEYGRHNNVSVICTSHEGAKGAFSKTILNEASHICCFPNGTEQNEYLLRRYVGIKPKDQLDVLERDEPSRWALFHKNTPRYGMTEKETFLI